MTIAQCRALEIADVKIVSMVKHGDSRGHFTETYSADDFAAHGMAGAFVQDNQSYSAARCVLRGLHYQLPPFAQTKLVRVLRGAILDVAVDLRRSSNSFGRYVSAIISAENCHQIWVPEGFAHGFVTLLPDTEILYKVTAPYAPDYDRGIIWNDPTLAIAWPVGVGEVILSAKDKSLPLFAEQDELFD